MAKKIYPVLSPILADKKYGIGEEIILEEKQAEELAAFGAVGEATGDAPDEKTPNGAETIKIVQAAATIEELDALAEGETRKGVLTAIDARRKELGA